MGLVNIIRSWMAVTLVLLLGELGTRCHGRWEHERTALLLIKSSFKHSPPYDDDAISSWGTDADCCTWPRVGCNASTKRVTELHLAYTMNPGSGGRYLNASLFLPFKDLTSLDITGNKILGCAENEGLEKLSRLARLESLRLGENGFNESILSSLRGLSSLKSLDLSGSRLHGIVDIQDLHYLTSLEELYLENNEIEGVKPFRGDDQEVLRLSHLRYLVLSSNTLDSSILSSLKGLSSLKQLDLRDNQLRGSINMKELHALTQLEELDLRGNEITRFVATGDNKSWSNCSILYLGGIKGNASHVMELESLQGFFPNLESLYLTSYNLQGTSFGSYHLNNLEELFLDDFTMDDNFFQSFEALVSLRYLSMQLFNGSQLTKGWPYLKSLKTLYLTSTTALNYRMLQIIGNLISLEDLSMFNCYLSGPIPMAEGLCQLNQLKKLDISSNNLSGTLPPCMANLTSLNYLDLSYNQFMGNISLSPLRTLISIEDLRLAQNQFQIPLTLSPFFNHTKLYSLFADGNNIFAETEQHNLTPKFQLTYLLLSGYGYGGTFPRFLYYQFNLHHVDLSHIQLSGGFPHWLLENNTNLFILSLVNNSLSGELQLPSHSNMSLGELDISQNWLRGHVPALIGAHLPNLQTLNMSRNDFNGRIPPSLGNMSSLSSLDLSNNGLSGVVPEQLATGCLMLDLLVLSNNSLQGQIFPRNFDLQFLRLLQLDSNQLTGTIPNVLFNGSSLTILDLSHNNIHGKLPLSIGNMSALRVLDFSENSISGSLPLNFPSSMQQVYLFKNKLQGPLEKTFYNNSFLVVLDLGCNYFTGSIPKWIHRFSDLRCLLLDNNYFKGEIPIQVCKLDKISLIDFSHNYLSGHILPCLRSGSTWNRTSTSKSSWTSVPYVFDNIFQPHVEFTTKSNSYSYEGRILTYMSGIDLSCNNLMGQIPPELGNLSTIKVLNLSHNSLTGPIPSTFSNFKEIDSLDLSYNNLEGKIPSQLTQLFQLEVFTVAHNNLSGKTPERVAQFATFENRSYEDNPLLCGPPLTISCSGRPSPPSLSKNSSKHEEETGWISMDTFYPSFLASYIMVLLGMAAVLYINPHWRQVWFYFVEECINNCYYFIMDNLPILSKYRVSQPCI